MTQEEVAAYKGRQQTREALEEARLQAERTRGVPQAVAYLAGQAAGELWPGRREGEVGAGARAREYLQREGEVA